MGDSPHSIPTFNSLSTSSTSSTSSLLNQTPISTSLPSFSSSVSTYVGPVAQSSGTTNVQIATENNGALPSTSVHQQRQITQASQSFSSYRAPPPLSGRNGPVSINSSTASALNIASPTSLVPPTPRMERSNSTSTMYSASGSIHEKSMSASSITVNSPSAISSVPSHKESERYEHDKWSSLVAKVLPLFNGEGLKACIEDLNELVR
ncbi:3035_t:CDS:1 [Acaulospora colombiana]|uniref:3035_t:CDS:1 n=1 Tax=Acaulospora colombiana TaxID=27376 RepID=A0ACA9M0S3_9GLOM|nr:3035_t:CDS:1 [Acaulospora colombiana]